MEGGVLCIAEGPLRRGSPVGSTPLLSIGNINNLEAVPTLTPGKDLGGIHAVRGGAYEDIGEGSAEMGPSQCTARTARAMSLSRSKQH